MATNPVLTIHADPSPGKQTITWSVSDAPSATLISIVTIINDNTVQRAITETAYPPVVDGVAVTSIVLDDTILPVDRKTFVKLVFIYSDKTNLFSQNTLVLSTTKSPATPILALSGLEQSVRAEDSGVSINLSQYLSPTSTKKSIKDGFSELTKVQVLISKVDGLEASDLQLIEKDVVEYDEWIAISTALENNAIYEIAIKVLNAVGVSPLSNTISFSPKDTPSQIEFVKAFSSLSDQKRKSATTFSDDNGDVILYWTKPIDYEFLKSTANGKTATPVTKYIVTEQEYEDVTTNGVTSTIKKVSGLRTIDVLDNSSIQLEVNEEVDNREDIDNRLYDYKYTVVNSHHSLGKKYKYQITPVNINGDGPISTETTLVQKFKAPDAQPFELRHNSTETSITGSAINIYNGTMNMRIAPGALASLNGGTGYQTASTTFTYPVGTTVPDDEKLQFDVTEFDTDVNDETPPVTVFSGLVTFVQKVTSATTGTGVNAVTTYTPTGEYNASFSSIDVDSTTSGTQSLDSVLQLGKKYSFKLYRQNKDPVNSSNTFLSVPTVINRTKFSSPTAVKRLQNYAINDDLTPVTSGGSPAIRLLFQQLSASDLNGLDAFTNTEINYYAYQQSFRIPGLAPILHNHTEPLISREFITPQSQTGVGVTQYIRVEVFNPELDTYISAQESTPAVSETSITFPNAVLDSSVSINKVNASTIKIGFTRQVASLLGGSGAVTEFIQNRIIIMEDGATVPAVAPIVVPYTSGVTYLSPDISLITGKSYAAFIVAERVYTKASHLSTLDTPLPDRFSGVLIRNNFFTDNFVMNGTPTIPRNIELFPSNKKLEILYDEPLSLNGVGSASLKYHFFMNQDATDFPLFTTNPQVFQASVADVSGSSIATLTKAFALKSASNNRENVVDLENDLEYKFAMRVIGSVGGNNLTTRSYSQTISTGSVNGITVDNVIALTSKVGVAQTIVNGDISAVSTVVIANSVPEVTELDVAPAEEKLNVTLKKDGTGSVSDLLIIVDNNDSIGSNAQPIVAFDTRSLRTELAPNGLFNLETFFVEGTIAANAPNFVRFGFKRVTVTGGFKYELAIPNLVNGTSYSLSVRFVKNVNGTDVFGPAAIITRAPEAPPTQVQNVRFTVDSNKIDLTWVAPSNSGGAGVGNNSPLKYRVKLTLENDVQQSVYSDINGLSFTISTGLINGTNYKVLIEAYYVKGSDNSEVISTAVQANSAAGNLIKPNAAPVGATIAVAVGASSNTITGSITLPALGETNNYPVLRYDVYARHKSTTANRVIVQSFAPAATIGAGQANGAAHPSGLAYTSASLSANAVLTLAAISNFATSGITPNTMGHSRPLNGFNYEIVVEAIPNYTYAQAAPLKTIDASPYGNLVITSAVVKTGTSGRTYIVAANLNGSGSISNIVALAKAVNSASILVSNLSASTPATPLPAIVISGTLDNSTNFVAANQIATFELAFAAASGNVNDLLVVAVSQNGSDTIVVPVSGGFFN